MTLSINLISHYNISKTRKLKESLNNSEYLEITSISNKKTQIDKLMKALIWVESKGDSTAFAPNENAIGVLQIRPIMIRDVNRILKLKGEDNRYHHNDAWDSEKSKEIFMIWLNWYHKADLNFEKIARTWNGGPDGYSEIETVKYWDKVKIII